MQISFEERLVQAVSKWGVIFVFQKVSMGLEMNKNACVCFALVMFKATGIK